MYEMHYSSHKFFSFSFKKKKKGQIWLYGTGQALFYNILNFVHPYKKGYILQKGYKPMVNIQGLF